MGDWQLSPESRRIWRDTHELTLTPLAWDVLLYLVDHPQRLVTAEELLEQFWQGALSEQSAVRKTISQLRHALGDVIDRPKYIKTIRGQGYLFVAELHSEPSSPVADGLAVLPFENLTRDASYQEVADGLSDSVRLRLTRFIPLPIISRNSSISAQYKGLSTTSMGAALGAGYIVEGSVRKDSRRLRVIVQLTSTADGSVLWSDTFEKSTNEEPLAVEDDLATAIATRIKFRFDESTSDTPPEHTGIEADLRERLASAHSLADSGNPSEIADAIARYEALAEANPDLTEAWLALAEAYLLAGEEFVGLMSPAKAGPHVRTALERVLQLDPNNSRAIGLLGWLHVIVDYEWATGAQLMERSLAINPSDTTILRCYMYYGWARHEDETLKLADETTRMAGATVKMAEFAERTYKRSMRPRLDIKAPAPGRMTTSVTDEYTRSYMVTNAGGTAAVLKSIEGVVGSTPVQNTIDHFLHPRANFPAVLSWEIGLGHSAPRRVKLYAADITGNVHEWKLSGE